MAKQAKAQFFVVQHDMRLENDAIFIETGHWPRLNEWPVVWNTEAAAQVACDSLNKNGTYGGNWSVDTNG